MLVPWRVIDYGYPLFCKDLACTKLWYCWWFRNLAGTSWYGEYPTSFTTGFCTPDFRNHQTVSTFAPNFQDERVCNFNFQNLMMFLPQSELRSNLISQLISWGTPKKTLQKTRCTKFPSFLTSWWLNQPHLKNMIVKMATSSPIFGVKVKKNIWMATTHLFIGVYHLKWCLKPCK